MVYHEMLPNTTRDSDEVIVEDKTYNYDDNKVSHFMLPVFQQLKTQKVMRHHSRIHARTAKFIAHDASKAWKSRPMFGDTRAQADRREYTG